MDLHNLLPESCGRFQLIDLFLKRPLGGVSLGHLEVAVVASVAEDGHGAGERRRPTGRRDQDQSQQQPSRSTATQRGSHIKTMWSVRQEFVRDFIYTKWNVVDHMNSTPGFMHMLTSGVAGL